MLPLFRTLALFAVAGYSALPGAWWHAPIIRRHDVADSAYLLAAARIKGLVHIDLSAKPEVGDGEGTLVAPQWVLTAAHIAEVVKLGHHVSAGGERVAVDRICMHPGRNETPPRDIALFHLAAPVRAEQPVPLYRASDELDKLIWVVGYGDTGDGVTGPTLSDRRIRAATNRVDEVRPTWLIFAFDAPGTPRATPLEGISGPGDSGGPAYIEVQGQPYIAGVSSRQDIGPTNGKEGRYSVREMYTRISTHAAWIDSTMAGATCR